MDQWRKLRVLDAGFFEKIYYAVNIHPSSFLSASVAAVKCADMHRSISLQQEAKILITLKDSPYVVQFIGADVSINNDNISTYNLFLEYASGGSLHDLINNYKRGMRKMSELEPANVLVFDNAERGGMHKLKLTDFGLSLRVPKGVAYMTGATLSNRGTLIYVPPESLTSGFHGRAYDIWLLGCTVTEMMTGSRVWIYRNTRDLQSQIMNEYPMIWGNVSEMANDFLHKCLIKDRLRRWTSEQLLQHPFIQQVVCSWMPETQRRTARVNPSGCTVSVPEKHLLLHQLV
ncbi:mitogen-activated protein kinase kinase kinase 2-like [Solanum tuberosum]|uniref:ATP binding protein n=1 Tax=Solanum tuberosum TaxID=4113 RepID=M1AJB6_SOLTU|nr:PREDICTED: mitogen-activated protein kinase kinase kinase 2-like [Solanum tuberosum]